MSFSGARWVRVLSAAALLGWVFVSPARSAPTEYQLKAVFLLNFAHYVEWPAGKLPANGSIRFCVLGRSPFGGALAGLEGRSAQDHRVEIRDIASVDEARQCHLVYISDSEERRVTADLRALEGQPILTVSDIEGFVEIGGNIGFVTVEDRVRFDVNYASVQQADLRMSAQLLKVARRVVGMKGGTSR